MTLKAIKTEINSKQIVYVILYLILGNGTTSYSENIGAIGVTKVEQREREANSTGYLQRMRIQRAFIQA